MPRRLPRSAAVVLTAAALAVTGLVAPSAATAAEPTELFISEYVEGSSTNKAIEIYNPTGSAIDLDAGLYAIRVYFNGNTTFSSFALTGSIPAGGTFVFADNSLAAYADQTTGAGLWNGDDAVALIKATTILDVIGQIGVQPSPEWGTGETSTQNNTIRRNADVCVGDPDGSNAFDPSIEWTGYAQDTLDGLGSHVAQCGDVEPPSPPVVINEFVANHTGTDANEYIEVLATGTSDLSGYAVLSVEGDDPSTGVVDAVFTFDPPDADGRSWTGFLNNAIENGTMTLLLVSGTAPSTGIDLDADDNGVIDDGFGFTVVDAVAVRDGGVADLTYGTPVLDSTFGGGFTPGGASRIPDGVDTDAVADWTVNDFDLAGVEGFGGGSLEDGEAVNTPGAVNSTELDLGPGDGVADCDTAVVTIGSVQGSGDASPVAGSAVRIEGVVTGDFQTGGFNGYYVQDAGDADPATSDGIFVYAPGGDDVAVGDSVHVVGAVSEFGGLTEITADDIEVCATGVALPAATELTLPATDEQREALEGMLVALPQTLTILEYFEFGRFGTIDVGLDRQYQPTATYLPGTPEAAAEAAANLAERITIDDGRSTQNPDPAIHPNGAEFTLANSFRGGDLVTGVTGVLDERFDTYAIQPTQGAQYQAANPRPTVPEVGGEVTVASFNVLNYFTTVDPTPTNSGDDGYTRGADTAEELARQQAKIVAALAEIGADVFGLIEIENSGVAGFPGNDTGAPNTAVSTLTDALNAAVGPGTYAYIPTGPIGTDAITTALLYKPSAVTPVGDFQLMDESKDPRWLDDRNRPGLTQTFADADGGEFTVVVNHLKSKGSACPGDTDPEQGNCNIVRTQAADALADWLATDPTGQDTAGRELIIGDLNAYDKEDPIRALQAAGYTDLLYEFQGEDAYTYVFDGQLGYLDHALAGTELLADVTGAAPWNINADEPNLIDYDMSFKQPAQDALFAPDPYRSSDHDPVIVGLSLTPPDTTPPTIEATADPSFLVPPNNKDRDVEIVIEAMDDRGDVTVELTDVEVSGPPRADYTQTGDTTFTVVAVNGAVYRFTYTATDEAGNTATATAVVVVGVKGLRSLR